MRAAFLPIPFLLMPVLACSKQPDAPSAVQAELKDPLPEVTLPKIAGAKIQADGVLDEPAWKKAASIRFLDSMSGRAPNFPTTLRLFYDDRNLYAAFESSDEDATCPFANRDDPIYDHEAVELFLMPNVRAPSVGPYVELQASPKGVIFDASFTARRQNMDKNFNGAQTVGTKIDGTLNDSKDQDRGWTSEWIVPFDSLKWSTTAPKEGDEWRMNAFRIEKYHEGGSLRGEYTAWSPPMIGDFHNVDRFGRAIFGTMTSTAGPS